MFSVNVAVILLSALGQTVKLGICTTGHLLYFISTRSTPKQRCENEIKIALLALIDGVNVLCVHLSAPRCLQNGVWRARLSQGEAQRGNEFTTICEIDRNELQVFVALHCHI